MTIDEALDFWCESDDEYVDFYRRGIGYLNGVVAISNDEGENGISLDMHTEADFIEWMKDAKDGIDTGYFDSHMEAIVETMRKSDRRDSSRD